jgi:hypothetical protein
MSTTAAEEKAQAAFDSWWAERVAEGYQYGREPLANVRFGFEAGFAACNRSEKLQGFVKGLFHGHADEARTLIPLIKQLCADLNSAHDEILRLQGCAEFDKYDYPEWSPQANSIRWAEKVLQCRLAKTDAWTLFPAAAPDAVQGDEK